MTTATGPGRGKAGLLLAIGVVVLALNLRPSIVAVSPILTMLRADTGLSTVVLSLLTTVPLLCFGLLSPPAPRLAGRLGIVALGFGQSAAFSLALLFVVLRSSDGRHAAQLSSMAQACGYLVAAARPVVLGGCTGRPAAGASPS